MNKDTIVIAAVILIAAVMICVAPVVTNKDTTDDGTPDWAKEVAVELKEKGGYISTFISSNSMTVEKGQHVYADSDGLTVWTGRHYYHFPYETIKEVTI